MAIVGYVNVTDANGVLLGRFPLTSDDLAARLAASAIGQRVLDELPAGMLKAVS